MSPDQSTMLDSLSGAVPLSKSPRELFPPGRNGPVSTHAVLRWVHKGVIGPDGKRVRLAAIKIGGTFYVRPQDAEKFIRELNADSQAVKDDEEADLDRRGKEACKALEGMGF